MRQRRPKNSELRLWRLGQEARASEDEEQGILELFHRRADEQRDEDAPLARDDGDARDDPDDR